MPRKRKDTPTPIILGTEVEQDGDWTDTTTTDVLIGPTALTITETCVTSHKGWEESERSSVYVALYHDEMDRLIELYQQYRKEHEKRAVEN